MILTFFKRLSNARRFIIFLVTVYVFSFWLALNFAYAQAERYLNVTGGIDGQTRLWPIEGAIKVTYLDWSSSGSKPGDTIRIFASHQIEVDCSGSHALVFSAQNDGSWSYAPEFTIPQDNPGLYFIAGKKYYFAAEYKAAGGSPVCVKPHQNHWQNGNVKIPFITNVTFATKGNPDHIYIEAWKSHFGEFAALRWEIYSGDQGKAPCDPSTYLNSINDNPGEAAIALYLTQTKKGKDQYFSLLPFDENNNRGYCSDSNNLSVGHRLLGAPYSFKASDNVYLDKIELTWEFGSFPSDFSQNVRQWVIYRQLNGDTIPCSNAAVNFYAAKEARSYTDTSATPGYPYNYFVRAVSNGDLDEIYLGVCSSLQVGSKALENPSFLNASDNTSPDYVFLTWAEVPHADHYYILRSTSNSPCSGQQIADNLKQLYFNDSTAIRGRNYFYTIKAVGQNGKSGPGCPSDQGSKIVRKPSDIIASDGQFSDRVSIQWNGDENATQFRIWRDISNQSCSGTLLSGSATSPFQDLEAIAGKDYFYSVEARGENGVWSGCNQAERGYIRLKAPTLIQASDDTSQEGVFLSFNPPSGAISNYKIYRNSENQLCQGPFFNAQSTQILDTDTIPGVVYLYCVVAIGENGSEGLKPSAGDSGSRQLGVPTVDASDGQFEDRVVINLGEVYGAAEYKIYRSNSQNARCISSDLIVKTSALSYSDTGVSPGVEYFYTVKAARGDKNGPCTVLSDKGYTKLKRPVILASDGTYSDKVIISWQAVPGASVYNVFRSENAGQLCSGAQICQVSANSLSCEDQTVAPGKAYYYSMLALNSNNQSPCSDYDSGYAAGASPNPVTASQGDFEHHIAISWNAVPGATSYRLYRATTNQVQCSDNFYITNVYAAVSFNDQNINDNWDYFYRVQAETEAGPALCSDYALGYSRPKYTLSGKIAFSDGVGIANVPVVLSDGAHQTTSISGGTFELTQVTIGTFSLTASSEGYVIQPLFINPFLINKSFSDRNFEVYCAQGFKRKSDKCLADSLPPDYTPTATPTSTLAPTFTPSATPTIGPSANPTLTPTPTTVPGGTPTLSNLGNNPENIAGSLRAITECVERLLDGTTLAHFGYENISSDVLPAPVGDLNRFEPIPENRGQPVNFLAGRVNDDFSVLLEDSVITWVLGNSQAQASLESIECCPGADCSHCSFMNAQTLPAEIARESNNLLKIRRQFIKSLLVLPKVKSSKKYKTFLSKTKLGIAKNIKRINELQVLIPAVIRSCSATNCKPVALNAIKQEIPANFNSISKLTMTELSLYQKLGKPIAKKQLRTFGQRIKAIVSKINDTKQAVLKLLEQLPEQSFECR